MSFFAFLDGLLSIYKKADLQGAHGVPATIEYLEIQAVEIFELQGREFVELHNLLKLTGLCHSGGVAKLVVAEGQVTVDGKVELRKRCKIRPGQLVEFQGQQIVVNG